MAEENETIEPPEILYHYCSVDAFFNIIKSKELWMGSISFMNDFMEQNKVVNQFKSELETRCNEHQSKIKYYLSTFLKTP